MGNTLNAIVSEALQGVEIDDPELFLDFFRFCVTRDAAYLRGETREKYKPEEHVQAYKERMKAVGL